ncbi:MAG: hypothetical protein QW677_04575 [Pyrobaculum sp.]|uniref:hypothetical protein n=1 Tax=Pyrobaculum sp. TaxID=2004705 RepID=UPI003166426A
MPYVKPSLRPSFCNNSPLLILPYACASNKSQRGRGRYKGDRRGTREGRKKWVFGMLYMYIYGSFLKSGTFGGQ